MLRPILLPTLLLGCESYHPPPPNAEPSLAAQVIAASARMHERSGAALDLEAAIAVSDVPRVHHDALVIDTLDEPQILDTWRPYLDAVRAAAHRVVLAESPDTLAARVAFVGRACARCHEAIAAKVTFPAPPVPDAHATLADDMRRHQSAALQMWQGLIAPDDAAWRAGATGLLDMPPEIVARADDRNEVSRIKLLATRALEPQSQDARAALYGQILGTCAGCHATLRDR